MSKYFDEKIVAFLRRKENLPLALDIGRYAVRVRQDIAQEFWTNIKQQLVTALTGEWEIQQLTWSGYRGWIAIEKKFAHKAQALGFAVEDEQGDDHHDIYIGACWKIPVPLKDKNYSKGPLLGLREQMLNGGFESWPPEWVCGKYILQYPSTDAFYVAYAEDSGSIIKTIIEALSSLATQYRESVRAVNRNLTSVPAV